jgi:hypothetical protein
MIITGCSDVNTNKVETNLGVMSAKGQQEKASNETSADIKTNPTMLDIYKDPNCGCCEKWITHVNQHGFQSKVHNQSNLHILKEKKGIALQFRSCHTAISKDGYVFEGHVPAKYIQQFLGEKPEGAIGLSVPAMPIGSPGMEIGDRFMPYKVVMLMADNSSKTYVEVNTYQEQF